MEQRLVPALSAPATAADIVEMAATFQPDVLVIDCMMEAAFGAARTLALPTALLVHLSYAGWTLTRADEELQRARAGYVSDMDAVLALVPPGFEIPVPMPRHAAYVGPILNPNPLPALDPADAAMLSEPGLPWVLLSLSTTVQGQTTALPSLLEALSGLPVRCLLTLGGVLAPEAVQAPANVVVRSFLSHDLVLPHMSVVLSHGGLSTITASLAAGVPLVCVPQGRDQHDNAARVDICGLGRTVSPQASSAELAAQIQRTLSNDSYRRAAQRFAAAIAVLGRGATATDQVEALLQRTRHTR